MLAKNQWGKDQIITPIEVQRNHEKRLILPLYPGMDGMPRAQGCAGAAISRDGWYAAGAGMRRSGHIQGWMVCRGRRDAQERPYPGMDGMQKMQEHFSVNFPD